MKRIVLILVLIFSASISNAQFHTGEFDSLKLGGVWQKVWTSGTPYDSAFVAANSHLLQGKDTNWVKSQSDGSTNADSIKGIYVNGGSFSAGDVLLYNGTIWAGSPAVDSAVGAARLNGVQPSFTLDLLDDSLAAKLSLHAQADSAALADSAAGAERLGGVAPDFPVDRLTDSLAVKLPIAGKAADATVADSSRGGAARLGGYTPDFPVSLLTDSLAVKIPLVQKAAASGVASLNASTKVVEDPANATAIPIASKIVIADAGGTVDGWVTDAAADGSTKGKATFTATDFNATTGNISIDYTNGQKASESQPGFLTELATSAEINTGTDAARAISPDALAGSVMGQTVLEVYLIAATTTVTTGDGKGYLYVAPKINGMNIIGVCASLIGAASSSGTPTIQVARGRQSSPTSAHTFVDVLSTLMTIDASEWSCKDATTPAVINTSNDDLATGDLLRFDVDVAGTGAQGLIVFVICQLP